MKYGLAILYTTSAILLCGCGADKKPVIMEEALKGVLIDKRGTAVPTEKLLNSDYLLLYFSAHWCPPCQAFTPQLVDFYHRNGGGQQFNTILISNDHSEKDMLSYMRNSKMPWPAVQYDSDAADSLNNIYSGSGIPRLVLVNMKGEILADSFKGRRYLGPHTVLEKLKPLLAKRATEPAERSNNTGVHHPTHDNLAEKFKVNGFGQGAKSDVAIINEKLTEVGTELGNGIFVEKITASYVEVSYEGNHYRLYP